MTAVSEPAFDIALVAEATKKAGLVWLAYDAGEPRPAWHAWIEDAAYLVCGGTEQELPGLTTASTATVIVPSKDTRARLVSWTATIEPVRPGDERWTQVTPTLAAGRLNAEGGAAMIDRWARESTVLRLVPTGEVTGRATEPATDNLARQPRDTTATTLGRQPKMVGGVRRKAR